MIYYTKTKLQKLLKLDFIRFCIVGGLGFVINLGILILLTKFGLAIFLAQLIAAEIALGVNFFLHHHWTYRSKKVDKTISTLLLQFHATSWPAIIGSSLMVAAGVRLFKLEKVVALAISSLVALMWNFLWSKYVIWRGENGSDIVDILN